MQLTAGRTDKTQILITTSTVSSANFMLHVCAVHAVCKADNKKQSESVVWLGGACITMWQADILILAEYTSSHWQHRLLLIAQNDSQRGG